MSHLENFLLFLFHYLIVLITLKMTQKGLNIYLYSYYLTSGLLLPVLALVLHRVKGTKFRFITHTVTLLIISNIGALIFAGTNASLLPY